MSNLCPTHLDLLEVSMAKNGLFGPQLTIRLFTTLHFFGENPFFNPLDQINPPHDIHQRKAVHLSFLHVPQHKSFLELAGRQNFANAWRQE